MLYWLILTPWAGALVLLLLAFADYYLTLLGAKLYHQGVSDYIGYSGSYELNPNYQKEIDNQTRLSSKFVAGSLAVAMLLLALWYFFFYFIPGSSSVHVYSLLIGAVSLPRLVLIGVHFNNILLFRTVNKEGGLTGKITYARWLTYRAWQHRWGVNGGIFLLIFALTREIFFLGGAAMCFLFIFRFGSWAKKTQEPQPQPAE